jgi:hypothetical protein
MADLEIRGPGSYERAEGGLRRAVDTEAGVPFTLAIERLRMIEPPSFMGERAYCTGTAFL